MNRRAFLAAMALVGGVLVASPAGLPRSVTYVDVPFGNVTCRAILVAGALVFADKFIPRDEAWRIGDHTFMHPATFARLLAEVS